MVVFAESIKVAIVVCCETEGYHCRYYDCACFWVRILVVSWMCTDVSDETAVFIVRYMCTNL
jgi:uncharacterized membrane-anchored protein